MKYCACLFLSLLTCSGFSKAATLVVDAKSVIFAAAGNGNPDSGGLIPGTIPLPSGIGRSMAVSLVTGITSPMGSDFQMGPDGGNFMNVTPQVFGYNGIAGITDNGTENVMALMAVFTAGVPDPAARPAVRNITSEKDLAVMSTLLNQPFFVGDGRSSTGLQTFLIPDGATGLTFGFADAIPQIGIYQGPPGAYSDNTGALTVSYSIVPEPGSAAFLTILLGGTALIRRRKCG